MRIYLKISLILLFNLLNCTLSLSQNIDSIKFVLKNAQRDTTKLRLMLDLCELVEINEMSLYMQPAIEMANKLLESSSYPEKTVNWVKAKKALAINDIGFVYYNQGDIPNALKYYNESLKLNEEIGNRKGIALLLNNIGAIYDLEGDIQKALMYYSKSLKLQEEVGDKEGMANSFNNIGVIYYKQNDNAKALLYYGRGLKLYEMIGQKQGIASALNNIGNIYDRLGDTAKTRYYCLKTLKIMQETGYPMGIASAFANLADFYNKQHNFPLTLECYNKSLKMNQEINNQEGIVTSLHNIGAVYLQLKKYLPAKAYLDSSLSLSKRLGFPENIRNAEKTLARIDSARGDFSGAFNHFKQFIKYRDSIINQETQKAYITNQLNYEFQKKESETKSAYEKEQTLAEEKNQRQKIVIWAGTAGLLLIIIFSVFIFRSLQKNRRANKIITAQKEEVEKQRQFVEDKNHIIEEKQKEILDSIRYAKRIQEALIPNEKYLDKEIKRLKKSPENKA